MVLELTGEHTTARVMVDDESLVEAGCREQIETLIDHPAFTEPVRIMPDTHWGAGAPIGFTMPLGERVVPNIVGVDVGCGMAATNLGPELPLEDAERERRVREAVPMGRSVHDYDDAPHLVEEFPFERANRVFEQFDAAYADRFGEHIDPVEFDFDGYDGDYFEALCDRVLADQRQGMGYIIKSAGTLGGGNHFVEFGRARESGDYWLVIHSGSRYLGKSVAEYWQSTATDRRTIGEIREQIPEEYVEYLKFDPDTVESRDLYAWVTGGMGESYIRKERLRRELDGSDIEDAFDALGQVQDAIHSSDDEDRNTDLDWLEGREAHGYLVDMLFAQQYARWNRELMSNAICDAIGVEPVDRFQSIHNYIDFRDLTIRKGATPARDGQRLLVPFNMADGSIIARGKGNEEYHQTAPHGAGRVMSRRQAHSEVDMDEFAAAMDGIYSESVIEGVRDEAPMAYKDADAILSAIQPTAAVVESIDAVHNLKATE
ncbi:RNA-splicing ligase RtcB [Haloarcula sp. CBA1130]|uniref:RtcB family protein n=1 Tax=unclassified Haloarcula TaxID=2624677 RepID=UPI0012470ABD|nr:MULTISPECIES: RtcB family protein [unclassified Haloarcula]KAA9397307.1 RNA-splicing ligase RtcB [Haloarcula sp. CBA1129]KAA9402657.1 RNA-splicing ligase RtcB [Haloarcula sp. CBA1130]